MKTSKILNATLSSVLLLTVSAAQADGIQEDNAFTGNVSGFLGQKSLEDKDWGSLDEQGSLGVISDFKKESWPVSIAVDLIVSGDVEEVGVLEDFGGSLETHLGVRKIFEISDSSFQPYIGGGASLITASIEHKISGSRVSKSDDSATGYWVGAGMYYAMNDHFNIGVDVRYSEADVTIFDVERKAGGVYSGITAGYHW